MFKKSLIYQYGGVLALLKSDSDKPLELWSKTVAKTCSIKRVSDLDLQSQVLELNGINIEKTFITCPADSKDILGIILPYFIVIVKNLKKCTTIIIQIMDDKNIRRRFRATTSQCVSRAKQFVCTMPLKLEDGWNHIQFNLPELTHKVFGTKYVEALRVQIHANCRLRRVYFSNRVASPRESNPKSSSMFAGY